MQWVSFPKVKRPGRGVDHPPTFSSEVKESVELYIYSPSGRSLPVLMWTFTQYGFLSGYAVRIFARSLSEGMGSCISYIIKLITYVSTTFIINIQGYMFRPISRSSSGLHSRLIHWCSPDFMYFINVNILRSQCAHSTSDLICYVGLKMTDWWVETCSLVY